MKKIDDKKVDKRLAYGSWTLFFISIVLFLIILIFNSNFNINNLNNVSDYIYLALGLVSIAFFGASISGLATLYARKKHNNKI